jgi:hypothetical protein
MARRGSSIPKPLRPIVGGAVLVAAVRVVDAAWRRVTGRPTPVDARAGATDADARAGEPGAVRDRLAYALLLGGAMRLARALGLPQDSDTAGDAKDPE